MACACAAFTARCYRVMEGNLEARRGTYGGNRAENDEESGEKSWTSEGRAEGNGFFWGEGSRHSVHTLLAFVCIVLIKFKKTADYLFLSLLMKTNPNYLY